MGLRFHAPISPLQPPIRHAAQIDGADVKNLDNTWHIGQNDHMNERIYFYLGEDRKKPMGPVSAAELAQMLQMGYVTEDTEIATLGSDKWIQVKDLMVAYAAELAALPTTPGQAMPGMPAELPPMPTFIPTAATAYEEVPESAGACPNCGNEVALHGKPEVPEFCPHCAFTLRAETPSSLWQWFKVAMKKSFVWRGRATRMEFWGFYMFSCIISFVISMGLSVAQIPFTLEYELKGNSDYLLQASYWESPGGILQILQFVVSFIFIIPTISVGVRRLHDLGKSGAFLGVFFAMVAVFYGSIAALFYQLVESQDTASIGMWVLLILGLGAAIIGMGIRLLIYCCRDSQQGRNQYGLSIKYPCK